MYYSRKPRNLARFCLTINGSTLTVQNIRATGAITDTFSINKAVVTVGAGQYYIRRCGWKWDGRPGVAGNEHRSRRRVVGERGECADEHGGHWWSPD